MSAGHVHEFDPISGWCSRCTYRDDGRLAHHGDIWHAGHEYTPAELQAIRESQQKVTWPHA